MYTGETCFFFVRGIAGHASDFMEWQWRAADWCNQNTPHKARTISYSTEFWSVWIRRKWRARRLARVLRGYSVLDWRLVLVGHSEGTVLILDALRAAGWPRVEALHLVCGACDADFERNGINWALRSGAIGKVHVYIGGNDQAMWWENLVLGRLLFGISDRSYPLGLHGPKNVSVQYKDKVVVHRESPWDEYGHSTCWDKANFDKTMACFTLH